MQFYSSYQLIQFTIALSIAFVLISFFLSRFLTQIIISPVNKIKDIINNLSKGIIEITDWQIKDEIGEIILSVNALSAKLQQTVTFAQEVGNRNFETYYEPLSEHDELSKALLTMRKDLKNNEREMVKMAYDLTERNKDLEQFTYIVSHNLRAPVANIMGLSNLLNSIDGNINLKEEEQVLKSLSVSVSKLDGIILDLNNILRTRATLNERKETVFLSSLVYDIKASIENIINAENVTIDFDFSSADKIFTLKSYIYSIFYNLISNSIKYRQADISPVIQITSYYKDDTIHLVFKDNGKGFDVNKNGSNIFGLYKRFDTSVEGKGMGLFMVKTQVKAIGGNITLKSELNKGATFYLDFPVA